MKYKKPVFYQIKTKVDDAKEYENETAKEFHR